MRISANRAFSSGEFGRHSDGPFVVTGSLKTQVEKEWLFALSFSPNVLRFPILAQSHKLAVPKVAVRRPFDELELPDELRLEPPTFHHFRGGQTCSPTPSLFLGQVREGAFLEFPTA
jgi:hypothetical protein